MINNKEKKVIYNMRNKDAFPNKPIKMNGNQEKIIKLLKLISLISEGNVNSEFKLSEYD